MKALILLLVLLLASCASTTKTNSIRVTGQGSTYEQAKHSAFSTAVEYRVGSLIVSERESNLDKLTKEEILVYSAGFVDDYKVISQSVQGNQIILTVDVSVSDHKISQRIISKSTSNKSFDGNRHQTQVDTYFKERINGDKVLGTVLNDYPKRAFNIIQQPHQLRIDHRRTVSIVVPYTIIWNYNYIVSLRSVLDTLEEGRIGILINSPGNVVILAKDPKDYVLGKKTTHRFNDVSRVDKIADAFIDNEVRILMQIKHSNGTNLYCYTPKFISGMSGSFYGIGDPGTVVIFGNQQERGELHLPVKHSINDIFNIQLQIVSTKNC
jgi:hypothetical protein